jgi:lipoprotein-anchoring transpeptidase ErfK/SrfK
MQSISCGAAMLSKSILHNSVSTIEKPAVMTKKELQSRLRACLGTIPHALIHISCEKQELSLIKDDATVAVYPVSTSRYGAGNRDGSYQTPGGIHRIVEKIGDGAPAGAVFRDRIETGEICAADSEGDNLIVTRILRLEGCEGGINRGAGIDSYERCIYIHGTNKEKSIGTPISHGCVVMRSRDIIELFNAVEEGAIVVID